MSLIRARIRGISFVLLFASAVVVVLATASTSSARFAARTDNESNLWEAALLALDVTSTQQLFLDGEGLYPGLELENCIVVRYSGTLAADVRLHTRTPSGSLGRHFGLAIEFGRGAQTDCSDFAPSTVLFDDTLDSLERTGTAGLLLATGLEDGDTFALRVRGVLADTNDAQGTEGRFVAVVEARPT